MTFDEIQDMIAFFYANKHLAERMAGLRPDDSLERRKREDHEH